MRRWMVAATLVLLVGCGGAASGRARAMLDQFKAAGLAVEGVKDVDNSKTVVPKVFIEDVQFSVPSLGDRGGHVLSCASKSDCDQLVDYYSKLKALAGPYLYQSKDGLVVAQLNSGLTPAEAAKYQAIVER